MNRIVTIVCKIFVVAGVVILANSSDSKKNVNNTNNSVNNSMVIPLVRPPFLDEL